MKTPQFNLNYSISTRKESTGRGFTLIELLVVISIIALLLAIIMPALNKVKEQSRIISCRAKLKNIALALQMYLSDNDDRFCEPHTIYFSQQERYPVENGIESTDPFAYINLRCINGDLNLKQYPQYGGTLFTYLNSADTLMCPDFKRIALKYGFQDSTYMRDGDQITNFMPWHNYTMNAYLGGKPNRNIEHISMKKSSQVMRSSQIFAFTEESPILDTLYHTSTLNNTYMIALTYNQIQEALSHPTVNGDYKLIKPGPEGVGLFINVIAGYHNASSNNLTGGVGNCAFLDGHVGPVKREDTFKSAYPF